MEFPRNRQFRMQLVTTVVFRSFRALQYHLGSCWNKNYEISQPVTKEELLTGQFSQNRTKIHDRVPK